MTCPHDELIEWWDTSEADAPKASYSCAACGVQVTAEMGRQYPPEARVEEIGGVS